MLRLPAKAAIVIALILVPLVLQGSQSTIAATYVSEDDWTLYYDATSDDGVSITSAFYDGRKVFSKATIPYIPVEYDDGGMGLDELFTGLLYSGPYKVNLSSGFRIEAVYQDAAWDDPDNCGSYKYVQRWDFYSDGRFLPSLWILGPGEASDHTYHFRLRMDFDIGGYAGDYFYQYQSGWAQRTNEGEWFDDDNNAAGDYEWIVYDQPFGWRMGSYDSPSSMTVLKYNGGQDDYAGSYPQHPDYWDNNESIANADIVTWNITERRLADGSANCGTTSMVPGPFTEPWPGW